MSTATRAAPMAVSEPLMGGLMTRACNMPERRTSCTKVKLPVALAGISVRAVAFPTTVYSEGFLVRARPDARTGAPGT